MQMRPYQQECIDIIDQIQDGRHLVAMATGLGKTAVFSHIKRTGRTLILSHRDELVRQPERYYDCSYGIEKANEQSHGEEVVSASVQSLSKDERLSRFQPDDFDTIIIDEAHHAAAPTYKKILNYFSGARRVLGMTATPKRGDNVRLDDVFDDIIFQRDLRWGIKNEYLSRVRCKIVYADFSLKSVNKTAGDYNLGQLDKELMTKAVLSTTAKVYCENCHQNDRHTIIYCVSKETCMLLQKTIHLLLPEETDSIRVVTGDTPDDIRKKSLEDFQNGTVRCLINCMVLTEGTDLPVCDTILNLRPTCNASLYQQIVGRGTRLSPGKDHCLVIDVLPSDGSSRSLCTAPTLFGIDPVQLNEKSRKKLDENTDLLDFCDALSVTAADLATRIQVTLESVDRFISDREDILSQEKTIAAATKKYMQFCDRDIEDLQQDFGDIAVETHADNEKAFLIRPCYDDCIYLSKPDILGNVTIRFDVASSIVFHQMSGECFIGELPWKDAILLTKYYCLAMPPQYRYCWSHKAQEEWSDCSLTSGQRNKLLTEYRKKEVDMTDVDSLNKLEASKMIDMALQIKDAKKKAKLLTVSPSASKAKKEKAINSFKQMEQQELEKEELAQKAFGDFYDHIMVHGKQLLKAAEKEALRTKEFWKKSCFHVSLKQIPSLETNATSRQIDFLQSLERQMMTKSYRFPYRIHVSIQNMELNMLQASCLIEIALRVCYDLPKPERSVILDEESILQAFAKASGNRDVGKASVEVRMTMQGEK